MNQKVDIEALHETSINSDQPLLRLQQVSRSFMAGDREFQVLKRIVIQLAGFLPVDLIAAGAGMVQA
ncbi:hypothetical protein, partial [Pseudomonas viridiflava]|uniref:hypothetical protein n=1 Tax=Pseudomonas viridiflava TaxID=33069 RepID=UPI0013D6C3A6